MTICHSRDRATVLLLWQIIRTDDRAAPSAARPAVAPYQTSIL